MWGRKNGKGKEGRWMDGLFVYACIMIALVAGWVFYTRMDGEDDAVG